MLTKEQFDKTDNNNNETFYYNGNDCIKINPNITVCGVWYKLKINKGYTRYFASSYRFLKKIGYYNK